MILNHDIKISCLFCKLMQCGYGVKITVLANAHVRAKANMFWSWALPITLANIKLWHIIVSNLQEINEDKTW